MEIEIILEVKLYYISMKWLTIQIFSVIVMFCVPTSPSLQI
jgi:hypothetical protein